MKKPYKPTDPKRKKVYEVGVKVEDTWVFRVEAYSEKEALAKAKRGHPDAEQTHSMAGAGDYIKCLGWAEE